MYRHTVDDIKETSEKVFVSAEEKSKFSTYGDRVATIENTYTKSELDEFISELQIKNVSVQGEIVSETDTVPGIITDIEVFGNTKQRVEELVYDVTLSDGSIDPTDGSEISGDNGSGEEYNNVRSDYLEIKYLDTIHYKNNDTYRAAHVVLYDSDKQFVKYCGIIENQYTITDSNVKFVRFRHWKTNMGTIKLNITRTHLDDIRSVGTPTGSDNSAFKLNLYSYKKNLSDGNLLFMPLGSDNYEQYKPKKLENGRWQILSCTNNHHGWGFKVSLIGGCNYVFSCKRDTRIQKGLRVILHQDYKFNIIHQTINNADAENIKMQFTAEESGEYYITFNNNGANEPDKLNEIWDIQLELTNENTEYEECEKSVNEVILPVQLEKIAEFSDRLFRRDDGVWCIEKNLSKEIINSKTHAYRIYASYNVASIIRFHLPRGIYKSFHQSSDTLRNKTMASIPFYSAASNPEDKSNPWDSTASFLHHFFTLRKVDTPETQHDVINKNFSVYYNKSWSEQQILEWVDSQKITVVYPLHEPEIIELPLDTQITLNSFYGTTNVFVEGGDVQGEIKVTLPKSLGSSIETLLDKTNKVSNSIENIKKLKNGQVIDYKSNKGCINIENNSGIVSDVFLEGQTLVNLWGTKTEDFIINNQTSFNPSTQCIEYTSIATNRYSNCFTKNITRYKPNTKYTIIVNVFENTFTTTSPVLKVSSDKGKGSDIGISNDNRYIKGGFVGTQVFTITTLPDLSVSKVGLRTYVHNVDSEVGAKIKFNIIVLEGVHTDKDLSYFEGLKSVGDGTDKIVVESIKGDGNLFNSDGLTYGRVAIDTINTKGTHYNDIYLKSDEPASRVIGLPVRLPKNSNLKVYFKCEGYQIAHAFFDKNLRFVRDKSWCPNNIDISPRDNEMYVSSYIRRDDNGIMSQSDIEYIKQNAIITESINFESIVYTPYQSNKKALYYNKNNEWLKPVLRSLPNGVKDTIEKHSNGKYYYHKRCGETVFDGSENWSVRNDLPTDNPQGTHLVFYVQDENFPIKVRPHDTSSIVWISDIIQPLSHRYGWDTSVEGLHFGAFNKSQGANQCRYYINIAKSRLSTQDVQGFKQWLQANPVTVVYQLAQEKVYECNDLTLNLYDKSSIICKSGPLLPNLQVSVASFIGNILVNIKDRVSKLESTLYENYLFRNKMMLQNMYSSDDTLFKVALEAMSVRETTNNEDSELIELILKNIEPGKENYDRYFMETIIDFYTIIGKISFDVADVLFELIEKQHEEVVDVIVY